MDIQKINHFLRPLLNISDGHGNGNSHGNSDCDDYGDDYGHRYGDGDGDGYGHGHGNGNSDGNGDGHGNGYSNGYGDGYGHGNGDGIKTFNKQILYKIDNVQTIIKSVKNDVAKGFILNLDLTLDSCYIIRNDYYYSHGKTLKEALKSLEDKTLLNLPIVKRIKNFKTQFKDFTKKVKCSILYNEHFKLTGSCKMGRDNFIQNHSINLQKDKITINEFIELTKNSYGGKIIKQLL